MRRIRMNVAFLVSGIRLSGWQLQVRGVGSMKQIIMIAVFLGTLLALSASEAEAQYLYGYHGGLYRGYYSSYGPSLSYYGAFTPGPYTPAVGFSYPVYRS